MAAVLPSTKTAAVFSISYSGGQVKRQGGLAVGEWAAVLTITGVWGKVLRSVPRGGETLVPVGEVTLAVGVLIPSLYDLVFFGFFDQFVVMWGRLSYGGGLVLGALRVGIIEGTCFSFVWSGGDRY